MRQLLKILAWLLNLILIAIVVTLVLLWWTNRDISMAELEAQYGGEDLQRLDIDGVNLAYRVQGEGPPLVLIHSHFYTMRQWQTWVDILSQDFTVIRYDLTSHGLTGPDPSGDYSRARGAQLMLGLLDHLGIERTAIAGSSTGGGIAWYTAATFPDRVTKLILINAPGMPRVTNKYMERGMPDWAGYIFYLLPESLFRPFLEAPVVDNSVISNELVHEFHQMYRGSGNRWAEFERMQAWEKGDISDLLANITAPVLIMWGQDNPQLPVEHVDQYRQQLVNSASVDSVVYPDIGHVIPLEIPRQSAVDAYRFLQGDL